jgi:5-oxoprolinase (ATP-hydrolysing)
MVETAKLAGFDKVIGFDMGGTSTDVAHYDGEYERAFDTEVAGVRVRAPMMRIHTVAAGGGSILHYEAGRFRVGPDSAGANPGPACYRRGGPLAVTDANVMLGKLQPDFFPAIFGPSRTSRWTSRRCAKNSLRWRPRSATAAARAVAEGFVTIAVENMANAIKKISVQRGYDVTEYLLNCFGGAGGQHACLVADALGMEAVLSTPSPACCRPTASASRRSSPRASRRCSSRWRRPRGRRSTSDRHAARKGVRRTRRAGRRAPESVAWRPILHDPLRRHRHRPARRFRRRGLEAARRDFEAAHKAQFGFVYDDKPMIVESIDVEGQDGRVQAATKKPNRPMDRSRATQVASETRQDLLRRRNGARPASSAARDLSRATASPARR